MKYTALPFVLLALASCAGKETVEEVTSAVYTATQSTIYFSATCTGEALETPEDALIEQTITLYSDGRMEMYTGGHCESPSIPSEQLCIESGACSCDFTYSTEECESAECEWQLYEWREEKTVKTSYTQAGSEITVVGSGQTDAYDDITITLIDDVLTWQMVLGDSCIEVIYEAAP